MRPALSMWRTSWLRASAIRNSPAGGADRGGWRDPGGAGGPAVTVVALDAAPREGRDRAVRVGGDEPHAEAVVLRHVDRARRVDGDAGRTVHVCAHGRAAVAAEVAR